MKSTAFHFPIRGENYAEAANGLPYLITAEPVSPVYGWLVQDVACDSQPRLDRSQHDEQSLSLSLRWWFQ
jgi:hypothetical protein